MNDAERNNLLSEIQALTDQVGRLLTKIEDLYARIEWLRDALLAIWATKESQIARDALTRDDKYRKEDHEGKD